MFWSGHHLIREKKKSYSLLEIPVFGDTKVAGQRLPSCFRAYTCSDAVMKPALLLDSRFPKLSHVTSECTFTFIVGQSEI